jgi:hypothetical protein
MDRWQIMRNWAFKDSAGTRKTIETKQLAGYGGCVLLGAAGIGKTSEMKFLCAYEGKQGFDVRFERLAPIATSSDKLEKRLTSTLSHATEKTIIYLDAFDEAMIPLPTIALNIASWIKGDLKASGAKLRIASRSAVWPRVLEIAIEEAYPKKAITASLEPLTSEDIQAAAAALDVKGGDFDEFKRAVTEIGASVLTQQPLTLEMMLRMFQADRKLARNRKTLFERGMVEYTKDREERREVKTGTKFSPQEILEAAERLACFVLLSGRERTNLGDSPPVTALGLTELMELPGAPPLNQDLLEAVGNSGLCEHAGSKSFEFAHRQFAEYLAGRRIAKLLPHQAKSILSTGIGSEISVAGPLRETASFAAMHSDELANWIVDNDPEVIGLSDVANETLRRGAMLEYLDRFRKHKLPAGYLDLKNAALWGFKNKHAEADLRRVLRERGKDVANLLECAIRFCANWRSSSMSDDLARLVLDIEAPHHPRKSAGYALAEFGTPEARLKLKPLILGASDDVDLDLKGIALRCNWPERITVPDLLDVLTPRRDNSYAGAYDSFVLELDHSGFSADGYRFEGLVWANSFVHRRSDYDPLTRIARRIAHAAVDELENPAIVVGLAKLLISAWKIHSESPLDPLRTIPLSGHGSAESPAPLIGKVAARRVLIAALIAQAPDDMHLWQIGYDTPGLRAAEDFEWLFDRAIDSSLPLPHRTQYANFAGSLPWGQQGAQMELWLSAHAQIPRESRLYEPLSVRLESEEAISGRKMSADMERLSQPRPVRKVHPLPEKRVLEILALCETKDPRNFFGLSAELTLKEDSTHYGFERFLSRAPGWIAANELIRSRILEAAKSFILAETDEPERIGTQPLNSILSGYMHAIWLILEIERSWVETLPEDWWRRWMVYLLRQIHLNLSGEPDEPKLELFRLMHRKAPLEFRKVIVEQASLTGTDSQHFLSSLLNEMDALPDRKLDEELGECLSGHRVSPDRIGIVAQFILGRDVERAFPVCISLLDRDAVVANEETAIHAAAALMFEATSMAWDNVSAFLRDRRDLAPRILAEFAHNERLRVRKGIVPDGLGKLTTIQLGELISFLLEFFPYESDPHHDGAHIVGCDDSARTLRSQLISALASQKDAAAVLAWRQIVKQFRSKYPWLHDMQLRVERDYRMSQWSPIPPTSVASLLDARDSRLIRSEADALGGILDAISGFGRRLRAEGHYELEALWNTKPPAPSPKAEEHISDSICGEITKYFQRYAVTAGREMQIFRRKISKRLRGEPGSEVDLIVQIPARGAKTDEAIVVPIEVKLSRNIEARTGLRGQLVDRYMRQLGTNIGVFVVAWMDAPGLASKDRPIWANIRSAKKALERQARTVNTDSEGVFTVQAYVIDATLHADVRPKSKYAKKKALKKAKPNSKLQTNPKNKSAVKGSSLSKRRAKTSANEASVRKKKPRR